MSIYALRKRAALVAAAVLSVGLVGCGGSASSPDGEAGDTATAGSGSVELEKTSLVVGVQAFAELAPIHIALEQGLFEEQGLTVELTDSTGGGAGLVPGMVSGDIDIAYSNYVSLIQGRAQGLPLQVIRENDRPGVQALYVMPDSGIDEPADLAGKRIAVNGLGNIMELTSRAVLGSYGLEQSELEFVEVPPPNMAAALETGQVSAAWLVEPFVTIATNTLGVEPVVSSFEGPTENLPVAGWAATEEFVANNPNTTAAFVQAMNEAMEIASEDKDAVNKALLSYTQIPEDVVEQMGEINFAVESDFSQLATLQDLMIEFGIIEEPIDLEAFVADIDTSESE